jgi:wyosine [tRNA(Phe)-imidazoG37] synthetase (radical SAM superfamily)
LTAVSSIIYGPVPSWRLGRSLGIDLLSTNGKICSFDCIYCQLGRTKYPLTERKQFVNLDKLAAELEKVKNVPADYATFSGVGEPTLASNLGKAIEVVRATLGLPVAVLTNSSLMSRQEVRRDLSLADVVVAKVDAPNERLFQQINRPVTRQKLGEILRALKLFRKEYKGKLALQMMFIEENKGYVPEMAGIAKQLLPDEIQINTPLRPCAVSPLSPEEIASIRRGFSGIKGVVTVYQAPRLEAIPLNQKETLLRRPTLK